MIANDPSLLIVPRETSSLSFICCKKSWEISYILRMNRVFIATFFHSSGPRCCRRARYCNAVDRIFRLRYDVFGTACTIFYKLEQIQQTDHEISWFRAECRGIKCCRNVDHRSSYCMRNKAEVTSLYHHRPDAIPYYTQF